MIRFCEKWADAENLSDSITPYARDNLTTNEKEARKLQVIHGRGQWYETVNQEGLKILVNTDDGTCDCGVWQISGLPCMHAIAVYMYKREFDHDHVHWYYSKEAWKLTYNGVINPIPDESKWSEVKYEIIEPPVKKTKVGRPKKKRTRAPYEPLAPNATFYKRCSKCGELGHNRATCRFEGKDKASISTGKKVSKKVSNATSSRAQTNECSNNKAKLNDCSISKAPTTYVADVCSQIGSNAKL